MTRLIRVKKAKSAVSKSLIAAVEKYKLTCDESLLILSDLIKDMGRKTFRR